MTTHTINNELIIEGARTDLERLLDTLQHDADEVNPGEVFTFHSFVPVSNAEQFDRLWGSHGDAFESAVNTARIERGHVLIRFLTSWGPPHQVVRVMKAQHPHLKIRLDAHEISLVGRGYYLRPNGQANEEETVKEAKLAHYAQRPATPFIQADAFAAVPEDQHDFMMNPAGDPDNDVIFTGATIELMTANPTVRALISVDADRLDAVRALRKIARDFEASPDLFENSRNEAFRQREQVETQPSDPTPS